MTGFGLSAGVRTAYPADKTIPQLFAASAERGPAAPAVRDQGRELTYRELDEWSDRVAWALLRAGARPAEPVGLLGGRCLEAPVGALAIMKAGGAYVPLDPADPGPRRRELVRELGIGRVVALPGDATDLGGLTVVSVRELRQGPDRGRPVVPVPATDPAYILFTSGATGPPKAVAVAHRSVARLVLDTDYVTFGPRSRVAATGHPGFDASVFECWGALLNGGCLVVVDQDTLLDATAMHRLLVAERIDVLWLSAGVFHHLARVRPDLFRSVGFLISGGDVLAPEAVREVLTAGRPGQLVNGYGPTENTTFSTTYRIAEVPPGLARIPIGRPIANSTCYVVTDSGTLAETGQEGELWVGGDGVALGYVNDPELTGRRFVPDPFGGPAAGRVFRTGDRVRWLPGGVLDFLGRRDRMVKVRDFRIELDEIEAALRGCPGVGDAAVVAAARPSGKVIEAFYTAAPGAGAGPDPGRLRTMLGARLPAYLLPGRFVPTPRLPLTPSGKVDRARLSTGGRPPAAAAAPPARAAAPIEAGLARVWEEVLDVDRVDPADDFFELGGNSLLAATIFARLRAMFGIDPGRSRFLTRRLLADPSLRACAVAVQQARDHTLTHDDAGDDIDWWQAASVELPVPAATRPGSPAPARILLTGASGFLGSYLLRHLLEHTDARVHCLVRADSDEHARQRLAGRQLRLGLGELPAGRVVALCGDLARPSLGWAADRFDGYGRGLDAILHAGAYVNFTYPYARLAPTTVGGTVELVRLAARAGIPLHFVSTLAVLAGFGAAGVRQVDEDTAPAFPEHLYMGYTETKWVAEQILSRARAAGLPVAVHRPYEISGDLRSGAWNLESATCALFKVIVDSGLAPDIDLALDLTPVDVLAAQIVHILRHRAGDSRTYHHANPAPATLRDMVSRLRARGYRIRTVPFGDWVPRVVRFAGERPDHPFTPFLSLWVDRCPRNGLVLKEMFFAEHFPAFGRAHARAALADAGIRVPPVDAALLDHYLDYFQRAGFLGPAAAVR